jgi:hypothetical protein
MRFQPAHFGHLDRSNVVKGLRGTLGTFVNFGHFGYPSKFPYKFKDKLTICELISLMLNEAKGGEDVEAGMLGGTLNRMLYRV